MDIIKILLQNNVLYVYLSVLLALLQIHVNLAKLDISMMEHVLILVLMDHIMEVVKIFVSVYNVLILATYVSPILNV